MSFLFDMSFVIPARNEQGNIGLLCDYLAKELDNAVFTYEVLIVNDNSTDATYEISLELSKKYTFVRSVNKKSSSPGMGSALKYGTQLASGRYVVWIMADLSDDLSILDQFFCELEKGADLVVASRYMKGGSCGDMKRVKYFLSKGYGLLAKVIFGIKIHDITNAYRAFKKDSFESIFLTRDNFAVSPEQTLKAHIRGLSITELPVCYRDRKKDKAKFRYTEAAFSYVKVMLEAIFCF